MSRLVKSTETTTGRGKFRTFDRNKVVDEMLSNKPPLSAWERRKQYMQDMKRRASMIPKVSLHSQGVSESSTGADKSSESEMCDKENRIQPTSKPKGLRRSASYTILPSTKDTRKAENAELVHQSRSPKPCTNPLAGKKRRRQDVPSLDRSSVVENPAKQRKTDAPAVNQALISGQEKFPSAKQASFLQSRTASIRRQTMIIQKRPSSTTSKVSNTAATKPSGKASLMKKRVTHNVPKPTRTSLLRQQMRMVGFPQAIEKREEDVTTADNEVQKECKGESEPEESSVQQTCQDEEHHSTGASAPSHEEKCFPNDAEDNEGSTSMPPRSGHHRKSVKFLISDEDCLSPNVTLRKTPKKTLTLRERFEVWMATRGVSPSKYRHVHCFGMQLVDNGPRRKGRSLQLFTDSSDTPRKENHNDVEELDDVKENCEPLSENTPLCSKQDKSIIFRIDVEVKNVLSDLKCMLMDGYDSKDVSAWLSELRKRVASVEDHVIYWECLAIVAAKAGNVIKAIDIFNQAAEQGVEPAEELTEAVGNLLNTFGSNTCQEEEALSATEERTENKASTRQRSPFLSSSNIIQSTVIRYNVVNKKTPDSKHFALDRNKNCPVVVTPVRRSGRIMSRSATKNTEGLCLDAEKPHVRFQKNHMLPSDT